MHDGRAERQAAAVTVEQTAPARRVRRMHMALSVDVDRFSDAYLRKTYDGMLIRPDGSRVGWREIRGLCAEHRAKGFAVFPPCDNTDEQGHCLGHEEPADG